MKESLIKLVKHSGVYSLGKISTKLIAFLLIPIYTSHLSPNDYGILQICNIFSSILVTIILMGMSSSLFKVYFSGESNRSIVLGTTIINYLISSFIFLTPLFFFSSYLSPIIIGNYPNSDYLFKIILASVFVEGIMNLEFAVLRAREESLKFVIVSVINIIVYASLNIIFVVSLNKKYIGVREAVLITCIISVLIMVPFCLNKIKWKFNKSYSKEILQIGIPLAIAGIASWILNMTDRFMIKYILPPAEALAQIGIYSLGDKFAQIVRFILVMPFMMAWGPMMYSYQNHPQAKKMYKTVLHYFAFIAGLLCLLISFFSPEIIILMARQEVFYAAYKVVPILTFSKVLLGLFMIFTVGVTLTHNTKYIAYSNYIAAGLNIILNFILIPKFGIMGAAIASLLSYIICVFTLYKFAQKVYQVNWQISRVFFYFLFLFSLSALTTYLNINLSIRVSIFVIALLILPSFKLVSYREIKSVYCYVKGKLVKKKENNLK